MQTLTDPHRAFVVDKVRQHYEKFGKPILLSDLGTLFAHEFGRFTSHYDGQLRGYIEGDLKDQITIVGHPTIPQKLYVAPVDKQGEAAQFAAADSGQLHPDEEAPPADHLDLPRLQRAVLLAFQITPDAGKDVYLTCTPPFRFHLRSDPPTAFEKLLPIDREYSLRLPQPKQIDALNEEQKHQLSEKIIQWARTHRVDIHKFYFERRNNRPDRQESRAALDRLIDSQDDDIKKRLLIPADIVQHLMRIG